MKRAISAFLVFLLGLCAGGFLVGNFWEHYPTIRTVHAMHFCSCIGVNPKTEVAPNDPLWETTDYPD